jgi:hypothetical protein
MQDQTSKDDLYLADAEGVFGSIKVGICITWNCIRVRI